MKLTYYFLLFYFCSSFAQAQKATVLSATSIKYTGEPSEAINDIQAILKSYRAGEIIIEKAALGDRTGQAFYLAIENNRTQIYYTTTTSLENAIYTYLDILGFRWYGPGDNWSIKPQTIKRDNRSGSWISPSFRNRLFFGTGGLDFGVPHPFDPDNMYKAKWYAWKRRNRFNADFTGAGHIGQAFYLENKSLLDAHPEWFTNETGKKNGRIRIDNVAAVNAFRQWIKKGYQPSREGFVALSVDPEDGRGGVDDPLPSAAKMKGIKNHADKWWWLANEVAKDYPEDNKRLVITAYAYGDGPYNALAPSFPLRKNVYPVIIPYAFQTAYFPAEMIKTWAAKVEGTMGIYDYWNITQWSLGMPSFNIYSMLPKLKLWKQNKIDGIYLETTDAAGPMGHALWLAGQLEWNIDQDFEKLYTQYLNDCFGSAAPVMRVMYDRWSKNYQAEADVALSLSDLRRASDMVGTNTPEWKRINELKAYAHFMKLYYEHDGSQQSKDNLFRYMYGIHHLMMVQTAAFTGQAYISPLDKGNVLPDSKGIRPLRSDDIEAQFRKDLTLNPIKYKAASFSFDYDKVTYTKPIDPYVWLYGGFASNFLFKAPFSGTIQLDVGAESTTSFSLHTDDKVFFRESAGSNNYDYKENIGRIWSMKKYRLTIEKGKTYYLQCSGGFSRVKIITPGIVLFKSPGGQDFDNYAYPVQYFYVPRETTEIIFFDAEPEGTNGRGYLVSPDGKVMKREKTGIRNFYRVPVDPAGRGKVWKADFGHPSWSLKNIPNITSLQPFKYSE